MFEQEKYIRLTNDFEKWWEHTLERPIIQVSLTKKNPQASKTRGELLDMCYDMTVPVEQVVKAYQESFEDTIYLGDAFPCFYMRSTGILGAYLGQTYTIDKQRGTIWFQEIKDKELQDIQPILDKQYPLYKRTLDIMKEFQKQCYIPMGIANLGGMMDIVESMRGANHSLLDLYDEPEEVERLNDAIYKAFEQAYQDQIDSIDLSKVPGYTGWITLLSKKPYFISQCDFCCMIGQEQFEEFIYPTLKKEASLIERSFYHLDGPGAIRHLDRILDCGFLGIQWIQGAGSEPLDSPKWTPIYQKVLGAGKLLQVNIYSVEDLKCIDHIVRLVGSPKGIAFICTGNEEDRPIYEEYLRKYNVPIND